MQLKNLKEITITHPNLLEIIGIKKCGQITQMKIVWRNNV